MKLQRLTETCGEDDCPTVYLSDRGTFVFQGTPVADADGLRIGADELAVEMPVEVVYQAFPGLSGGR